MSAEEQDTRRRRPPPTIGAPALIALAVATAMVVWGVVPSVFAHGGPTVLDVIVLASTFLGWAVLIALMAARRPRRRSGR